MTDHLATARAALLLGDLPGARAAVELARRAYHATPATGPNPATVEARVFALEHGNSHGGPTGRGPR